MYYLTLYIYIHNRHSYYSYDMLIIHIYGLPCNTTINVNNVYWSEQFYNFFNFHENKSIMSMFPFFTYAIYRFFYLGLDAHDEMYFSDKLQQAIFVEVVSVSNFHLPQSNMLWKYLVEKSRNEKKKNPWLPDWMRCVSLMKSLLHPTPFRLRWQSCVPQPIPAVGESSLWIRP